MSLMYIKDKDGKLVPVPSLKGKDGKIPVKGTDYFTETDKSEMISAVITALPKYNGEVASV